MHSQHLSSQLASHRQTDTTTTTTQEYLSRLTQENQQLKLQISEKRLLQSEELNMRLI
jgi:hypothetical protein